MSDGLSRLNSCPEPELRAALNRACAAQRWVAAMAAGRPFASIEDFFELAERQASNLGRADWLEAFSHHPKIGDLDSLRARFAATADLASREQSGVSGADSRTLGELAQGNAAYEAKFGYIFIVCASGKSAAEMLSLLRARLGNPPDLELGIAAAEQLKITRLRLGAWLAESGGPAGGAAKEGSA